MAEPRAQRGLGSSAAPRGGAAGAPACSWSAPARRPPPLRGRANGWQTALVSLTLFGDVLAVTRGDLYWIYCGGGVALAALFSLWKPLLAMSVHEDLARVEGVRVDLIQTAFVLLLSVVVALLMKVVGMLLITALLIIPAAAARRFARSPETMAAAAALLGCVAVGIGLWGSLRWDTPAGPSVVVAAAALFAISEAAPIRHRG